MFQYKMSQIGCRFHLGQSCWRRSQSLGLYSDD